MSETPENSSIEPETMSLSVKISRLLCTGEQKGAVGGFEGFEPLHYQKSCYARDPLIELRFKARQTE